MKKFLTMLTLALTLSLSCTAAFAEEEKTGTPGEDATIVHTAPDEGDELVQMVEPDCKTKTNGFARYECKLEENAGKNYFHEVLIPWEHSWDEGEQTKEPNCTEKGEMTFTCTVCGETKTEEIEALGHKWSSETEGEKWGKVTVEPTCHSEGEAVDYCTVCGEERDKVRAIEALEHKTATRVVVDVIPTCVKEGAAHDQDYCTVCGDVLEDHEAYEEFTIADYDAILRQEAEEAGTIDEYVTYDGHDWDAWVSESEESFCDKEGTGTYVRWCKACGEKQFEERTVEPTGHEYELVKKVLLDCFHEEHTYECSKCEDSYTETMDVVSHVFQKDEKYLVEKVEPTCEEAGYTKYKCVFFDEVEGHEEDCEECFLKTDYVDALGHDWSDWTVRHEPGAQGNEFGYWIRSCKTCKKTEERISQYAPEEICEGLGHNWEVTDEMEATCTSDGYKVEKCFRCGKEQRTDYPATGHDYQEVPGVEPGCETVGYTASVICTKCGDIQVEAEEIPALGHDWDEGVVTREATAEMPGEMTYTCARCDAVRTEEIAYVAPQGTEAPHYSIAKDGNKVMLTLDENAKPLDEVIVYVVWSYTLADGTNLSVTMTMPASNDMVRLPNISAPTGATLDFTLVIVCDDIDLDSKGVAEANANDYGMAFVD